MRLSSVRALKAELKQEPELPEVFASIVPESRSGSALARRVDRAHTRAAGPNVVAFGIARGRGRNDYRLGVRIQLARRAAGEVARRVEKTAKGEADIRIVPRVSKRASTGPRWFRARRRPLEAGLSVGHYAITAGTLGFIVEDADAYYVLSNNHVLANVNAGEPGDPVVQPGPSDREPRPNTLIGVLDRYVPISFSSRANVVDCAVAALLDDQQFYVGWTEAIPGTVTGTSAVSTDDLGSAVTKAGRTTGVTQGTITQVEVDRLRVDMGEEDAPRIALFSDQIEIQGLDGRPFSAPGDSGSLIVDGGRRAIALLFSGGEDVAGLDLTFANRIDTVLQKLGVALVV